MHKCKMCDTEIENPRTGHPRWYCSPCALQRIRQKNKKYEKVRLFKKRQLEYLGTTSFSKHAIKKRDGTINIPRERSMIRKEFRQLGLRKK